ncbi:hypothetical protein GCM10007916_00950 [Psychromonas marina]|uniref:O-antigen ligase domain-containing protein n=1 Tax=Psychromonas marina TaxID=88364 RepID=A0ABQ6DV83_9GAMM|nr:O-antigen ligase family protein [Psychromonas marina]GLS89028.1 hypothetical protein GCM10007916_00950 [Psychromonas marina]
MMKLKKSVVENTLIFMSFGLLFVDAFTGYILFSYHFNSNISLMYKMFFLLLCLVYCFSANQSNYKIVLVLMLSALIWSVSQNITNATSYAIRDLGDSLKVISLFIVFYTFSQFHNYDVKKFIKLFISINIIILLINILATKMGYGNSAYSSFGAKGFFQAGNSLSSIIILLSSFCLHFALRKSRGIFFVSLSIFLVIALMVGTKSGMLGVLIVGLLVLCSTFKVTLKNISAVSLMLFLIFILAIKVYEFLLTTPFFDRFIFVYENTGIWGALLSGRVAFLEDIYPYFMNSSYLELLFGLGSGGLSVFEKPLVEMDWFDMLFQFGFIPTIIYGIGLFSLLKKNYTFPGNQIDEFAEDLSNSSVVASIVLVIISVISGHVLLNGVVTFFWSVLLSLPFWYSNSLSEIKLTD